MNLNLVKVEIGQDISGNYNGHYASAAIGIPLYIGSFIAVGSIQYIYNSQKRSEHLYSVSEKEAALTSGALTAYDVDSGTTAVKYRLRFITPLTERFEVITSLSHTRYNNDITSSPIVDKNHQSAITLIASYTF